MAHKKAGSSSKNGRDSVGQRLGVKVGDGALVSAGAIIVRQRGLTFLSGAGTVPGSGVVKPGIHPKYYQATVTCAACGNAFTVGSTRPEIRVDVCSNCHPFFTGQQS